MQLLRARRRSQATRRGAQPTVVPWVVRSEVIQLDGCRRRLDAPMPPLAVLTGLVLRLLVARLPRKRRRAARRHLAAAVVALVCAAFAAA